MPTPITPEELEQFLDSYYEPFEAIDEQFDQVRQLLDIPEEASLPRREDLDGLR